MCYKFHSDAGYLNESNARSRVGGYHYLGNNTTEPDLNSPILTPTGILKHVTASVSEAETSALFVNMKEGVVICTTLDEMDWPQGATPGTTDNSTAYGIGTDTIKQRKSRAIDMRYHWIRDKVAQQQFTLKWAPGSGNEGDYYTKHHPPSHHQRMRPRILHVPHKPQHTQ